MRKIINVDDINKFFKRFIDAYVVSDINKLIQINEKHRTSYPYLALAFMGIDFFGTLEKGVTSHVDNRPVGNRPVGNRFEWFIKNWMGKINPLYSNEHLSKLIYDSCRNGIFHNAILKNTFNVSSFLYPKSKHLHLIIEKNLIFFHSIQFAEDFLKAQNTYRKHILNSKDAKYIRKLCGNLSEMVQINLNKNCDDMNELIHELKFKKQIINQEIQSAKDNVITTSKTTTKTCELTHTEPPLWDE